jgi:hypothetical protein
LEFREASRRDGVVQGSGASRGTGKSETHRQSIHRGDRSVRKGIGAIGKIELKEHYGRRGEKEQQETSSSPIEKGVIARSSRLKKKKKKKKKNT